MVPAEIYYQLLTVFARCGAAAFPVMYALMTRRTCELYRAVFAATHDLIPEFVPEHVMAAIMADFVRRPLLRFRKYSVSQSPVAGFTTTKLC